MDNCNVREKIFFVTNGNLDEVNKELSKKGGKVKFICPVAESLEMTSECSYTLRCGDVFAYVVIEYNN